ncbi:hypothetical protein LRS05_06325 [Flavobacterium sp. J372]|uniref:hypothetical protein n=1 Tax=Flavobacterium sp. J372 TaxID=2898436 RepID=UPI0021518987|nr:hypothetical protein [Flavobacterium sp. J372]MCR5861776.1 hypothetical protein [Flavobacterium sp. J372]
MKNDIINKYFEQLKNANSPQEIDKILEEVIPILRLAGISPIELLSYFKMHENEFETRSQDHRNSISNSNKAHLILQKLMAKLSKS